MSTPFQQSGAQPQKQPRYAPLFIDKAFTGLYTQRSVFHDPSDLVTSRFYGGRPDTLWTGLNIELTNKLTLARRPGTSQFSTATYPQAPDRSFSFQLTSGAIQLLVDTPSFVYLDNQDGTKTTIFTKGAGAGQGYFVAVGSVCYYGDGVDTLKYTPGNPNGTVWNWGIATPTAAPSVSIVQSASSSVVWQANSYYSTMGLIVDANGNVQQLYTVNADGSNPTSRYGTASNGQPAWNQGTGGTTPSDGSVTWTNQGAITLWAASTLYLSGQPIYDPGTKCIFVNTHNYPWTSGTVQPTWNPALVSTGARTLEHSGGGKWGSLGQVNGSPTLVKSWSASTAFNQYIQPSSGNDPNALNCAIIEPTLILPAPAGQFVYLQGATTAGTTGSGSTAPTWATVPGQTTFDGQLGWVMLSSATWAATTNYSAWTFGSSSFSVIKDPNSNLQVCTLTGASGTVKPGTSSVLTAASTASGGQTTYTGTFTTAYPTGLPVTIAGFTNSANNGTFKIVSCNNTTLVTTNASGVAETHAGTAVYNAWGTTYGASVSDGSTSWTCVGSSVAWAANAIWYLPLSGFAPPSSSQPYGGAAIIDTHSPVDIQFVISSGKSSSSAPSWNPIGSNTTDNGITLYNQGKAAINSLSWTKGHVYAVSFKARAATDYYVTNIPPGASVPNGAYKGSGTGGISTASPTFTITGANTGAVNTVSGVGSLDPQVDTIVIWRDADGGGASNMFELTEIPSPPPIGGIAQPWYFQDYLPDIATSLFPGLNTLIPAPIDDENDPPPTGYLPLCDQLHFQRVWGAVGNTVYFSGGPDIITGNPNECFNPSDDFPFESTVTALIHTPIGLVCPTATDFECIYGGPETSSFFSTSLFPGVGLQSWNAWDIHGGEIYFMSADAQALVINPSLQLSRIGFAIGDQLAAWNPALAYVTVHESGVDNAVYWGDGSTGWYRLNPHQVPQGEAIWSPKANIVGGCQMLQSTQTAAGVKRLLIGGTGTNQNILKRDLTVFSDNGTAYAANFQMGAITFAQPGQAAALKFVECDFSGVGSLPTVSFLLDAPYGSFTNFVNTLGAGMAYDPPSVYGMTITPTNYYPNRYYFAATQSVARCRRMIVQVDFGNTDTVQNELLSLAVFGRLYQEA
jgi:hypothetical protein